MGGHGFLDKSGNCLKWQLLRLACFRWQVAGLTRKVRKRNHTPVILIGSQRAMVGIFSLALWLKRLVVENATGWTTSQAISHSTSYFHNYLKVGSIIIKLLPHSFISFSLKNSQSIKKPQTNVQIVAVVWTCQQMPLEFFICQSALSRWGRWAIRKLSFDLHSHSCSFKSCAFNLGLNGHFSLGIILNLL